MNILLLVPRMNIGGAETHVFMLAGMLQKKGHTVIVASGGGKLASDSAKKGIRQIYLPLRLSTDFAAFLLKFIVRRYKIDIIHAHSAAAGIAAVKCKLKYLPQLPVIYTAHGIFGGSKEKILLQCDKIIAVSECVKRVALENGAAADKVPVIYNGIDTERFAPQSGEKMRRILNVPKEAFCLAITARIKNLRNKGHAHLLDIMEMKGAANWHLLIIGTGKGKYKLRYQILHRHLQKRVHFLGRKTDVENYLAAADVVVLPSRFETFGLALAEGMAMEKPAVAYKVGGISEVIKEEQTGYLISYADKELFFKRLKKLADDKNLAEKMGKDAREDIKIRFSPEKMLDQILALYDECMKKVQD